MNFKFAILAAAVTGLIGMQSGYAQEQLLDEGVSADQRASSENIYFFKPASLDTLRIASSDNVLSSLQSESSVRSIEMIDVDARLLDGATQSFFLNFGPGLVLPVKQLNSYWLNDKYTAWSGEIDVGITHAGLDYNPNQAVFVRSGDRVFGQIRIEGQVFEVVTMEKGGQILIERDFSVLGTGDDTPKEVLPTTVRPPLKALGSDTRATNTVIRVLQAASPQAINALGGGSATVDRMNFFLAQANQVYANNGLAITLQDAGKFNSGANERSTVSSNASGLRSPFDGYIDTFAGATRNSRAADLVGLVVNTPSDSRLCGIVNAIGGGESNGFFVLRHLCTNFTFVHEIGHLFGARHDNDPTTSPFSFGHGFVSSAGNFRTIMAVSSNPQPRIALFSTPGQSFNGITAGNSFRDNERVHDIRRGTMASFR